MPDKTNSTDVIFLTSFSSMRLLHRMPANSPRSANGISSNADSKTQNRRKHQRIGKAAQAFDKVSAYCRDDP